MMDLPSHEVLARARRSRDPRFDGGFFIAVLSTGVYCRSTCPARPSPAVRYFRTAAEAGAAGYRPCLRCRPESAPHSPAWSGTAAVVRRALQLLDEGALDVGSIEQLANHVGLGVRHLNRLFLRHVGALPLAIAQMRRLNHATKLLNDTTLPMTQIALAVGFRSVRRFNETFKMTYGRSPRQIRRQELPDAGVNDEIRLMLGYRPPYDWAQVTAFLARRAIPGLERLNDCGYTRRLRTPSGHALITTRHCPERHALQVGLRGALPRELLWLSSTVRRAFDLSAVPEQISAVLATHPMLGRSVATRPGLRIIGTLEPFECCVRALLGQQVSVESGRTLMTRLVRRTGERLPPPTEGLEYLFPTPIALAGFDFTSLGLPATRARALGELARAVRDGVVRFDDPSDEIVRTLLRIPGIGPWTAQYIALRGLGDPDAFMPGDLVLRRVAGGSGSALTARMLEAEADSWRPWRGYAVMHLWSDDAGGRGSPAPARLHDPGDRTVQGRRAIAHMPLEGLSP
jgi:AraC family transcriptional regulator, regulatory protein of adaptative response / DNA-3-methyladenine glycosylase II